jgi:phosphoribosylglycinamide formyltransferase-1
VRFAVLCSGRGSNLQALLDAQQSGRLAPAEVVVVVSDVPSAPALERARNAGVEALIVDRKMHASREAFEAAIAGALSARAVDAVVLAGFMRLIGPTLLRAFPDRVLNIHPALLPSFPGLHGARQALAHGVKVAGCTVHLVDEGTDTGPIVLQAAVPVAAGDDEASLAARILVEEHRLLPEAVRLLAAGRLRREGRVVHVLPAPKR